MPGTPQAHCHKLIAEIARGAAHELYDVLMFDNSVRAAWISQTPDLTSAEREALFVERKWGLCVGFARATLAHMLSQPIEESLKLDIYEALCLDASLVRGRGPVKPARTLLNG